MAKTVLPAAGQHIRNVHCFHAKALVADVSVEVHEAAMVCGDDAIRTGLARVAYFLIGHADGDGLKLHGEGAAEAAAGLYILHFHYFKAFHMAEQAAGLFLDLAFTEAGTAIMISCPGVEFGAEIIDLQNVHQEFGEFESAFFQVFYFVMVGGVIKEFGVVITDEAGAGGAGGHYIIGSAEVFKEFGADFLAVFPEAGIECGLSAAGLVGIVFNGATCFLQHFHHIESCLRIELIYEAGDEKLNLHFTF